MREKVVFCWSGGKDSALALHELRCEGRYDVVALLTTCNEKYQRVSMHGVRVALAKRQAEAIGMSFHAISLSERSSNDEYEAKMTAYLADRKNEGVTAVAFGDIFLEDLRKWRETNLAAAGMRGIFPLWKRDTNALVGEFLSLGFASVVCCVSDAYFEKSAVGRLLDREFIDRLPPTVDPCGENGEFHTFAFDGPIFARPVRFTIGEKVYRALEDPDPSAGACRGFWYCDLLEA